MHNLHNLLLHRCLENVPRMLQQMLTS